MHCLAEYTPKSAKGEYAKFFRLTSSNLRVTEVTLSNSKAKFKKKPKSTIKQRKLLKKVLHLIMGALVGRVHPRIC